jgi:transposase-like protein
MKYAGNITILDDEGNVVHDRELTADEMIAELLAKPTLMAPVQTVEVAVPVVVQKRTYKKRAGKVEKKEKLKVGGKSRFPVEVKEEAVKRWKGGEDIEDVAKSIGVSSTSIRNWAQGTEYFKNKAGQVERGNEKFQKLEEEDSWEPPITPMQFSLIKDCMHEELSPADCARDMDVDIDQVRLVYKAKTHVDYVRLAREAKSQRYP